MILRKKNSVSIITLALFTFLFLVVLEIKQSNFFLWDDNATQFLPFYVYNWRAVVEQRTIPFINFHQYLGHTYLGQGQTGVFYFPIYIAVFLSRLIFSSNLYALDILVVLHLIASTIGVFFLLRRLKLSSLIAFFGSLTWTTFPFIILVSKSWVTISYAAAYLPFNFLVFDKLINKPLFKYALSLALLKMLLFFQGNIQFLTMLVLLEVFYLIIHFLIKKGVNKKLLICHISSFVFLFFLVAPLFLPLALVKQASQFRSSNILSLDRRNVIALKKFLAAQVFIFKPKVIFDAGYQIFYLGFPNILIFSLLIKKKIRNKFLKNRAAIYAFLALTALIFSSRIYRLFSFIPILNLFRWPFRYFLFFLFFITISICWLTNNLVQQEKLKTRFFIVLFFIIAITTNCYLIITNKDNTLGPFRIDNPPKNYLESHLEKNSGRIFTYKAPYNPKTIYQYFTFNFATLFGYFHFGGHDSLISKLNHELSLELNYINNFKGNIDQKLLDYLSFWGVKYIITENAPLNKEGLDQFRQLNRIYQGNDILLYENSKSLPLVYYSNNPEEKLPFEFKINKLNIYPNNNKEKSIAVNISPLLSYRYTINDEKKLRNINLKSIPVTINIPPNTKKVVVKYIDCPFLVGTALFLLFWLTILGIWLVTLSRKNANNKK